METERRPQLLSLGMFVRERRRDMGFTQGELAERTAWAQECVSAVELGQYGLPSVPLLASLAVALQVPLRALLAAAGFPTEGVEHFTSEQRADPQAMLYVLQRLLLIESDDAHVLLTEVSNVLLEAFGAEKFDAFVLDTSGERLVALGTGDSPLGRLQHELGLHILPLQNGGRTAQVFNTGELHHCDHVEADETELAGIKAELGIRSAIMVPLHVAGARRGVLAATARQPSRFLYDDLQFLNAVSTWIGTLLHRAELSAQVARETSEAARQLAAEELMSIVAHDVGNLLTPLQGRISMVKRRSRNEGRERDTNDLDEATRSIERTRRLVTELLDASRLDRVAMQLNCETIDLVELSHEVARDFEGQHSRIAVNGEERVHAHADVVRCRQVLWNLVANAVRHSPPDGPITITVRSEAAVDGMWSIVNVKDQGPGVASEVQPFIFDRFSRGPDSTGLGLGLFVSRSVAEAHGGTLSLQSAAGEGARFCLRIPALGQSRDG